MLFNSYEFIFFFLPITFFLYFYLNRMRLTEASKGFLVLASLFFYSWWNIVYLPLILVSMLVNYAIGNSITETRSGKKVLVSPKVLLSTGITFNIGLLGYFKYSDFFITSLNTVTGTTFEALNLTLPLAISFFTFQQIAYLIDSYKQQTREYDFLNYAVFVSFFPQLIAGPIVHHKEMMPQFAQLRNKVQNYNNIAVGLFIFSIGLFKKTVIADTFATWASHGFDQAEVLTFFEAWATSLSYTFQLYFDFSGYTDMAIGAALLFNIKLPINFNSPYKACDIQDFWRRWHITLSRFLRDYIYVPLGGNRKGDYSTYSNLMITFLIGGLWHGAGWTFVFWGFLHGLALVIHRVWKKLGLALNTGVAWFVTFNFINFTWVFFRAKEWDDALKVLTGMLGLNGIMLDIHYTALTSMLDLPMLTSGALFTYMYVDHSISVLLLIGFIMILWKQNSNEIAASLSQKKTTATLLLNILLFLSSFLYTAYLGVESEFLYFQF